MALHALAAAYILAHANVANVMVTLWNVMLLAVASIANTTQKAIIANVASLDIQAMHVMALATFLWTLRCVLSLNQNT